MESKRTKLAPTRIAALLAAAAVSALALMAPSVAASPAQPFDEVQAYSEQQSGEPDDGVLTAETDQPQPEAQPNPEVEGAESAQSGDLESDESGTPPPLAAGSVETFSSNMTTWGWGDAGNGRWGYWPLYPLDRVNIEPTRINVGNVAKVFAGDKQTFLVTTDGSLYGAGRNNSSQLGIVSGEATDYNQYTFTKINVDGAKVLDIDTTQQGTIALTDKGVYIWGDTTHSNVGVGSQYPLKIGGELTGKIVVDIAAAGSSAFLALTDSGDVYLWGTDPGYSLTYTSASYRTPKKVNTRKISLLAASKRAIWAVGEDKSTIYTIGLNGENYYYKLNEKLVYIDAASASGIIALGESGKVYTWDGTLGRSGDPYTPLPAEIPGGERIAEVAPLASAAQHRLVIGESGTVYSWGDNTYGQLGIGTRGEYETSVTPDSSGRPVPIKNFSASKVAVGSHHSVAVGGTPAPLPPPPPAATGSVFGYVWQDDDGNGIYNPSESAIPGVRVTLYRDNTHVATTTSDTVEGAYTFDGVPAGSGYSVRFDPAPTLGSTGWKFTKTASSRPSPVGSCARPDGKTGTFAVTGGAARGPVSAGILPVEGPSISVTKEYQGQADVVLKGAQDITIDVTATNNGTVPVRVLSLKDTTVSAPAATWTQSCTIDGNPLTNVYFDTVNNVLYPVSMKDANGLQPGQSVVCTMTIPAFAVGHVHTNTVVAQGSAEDHSWGTSTDTATFTATVESAAAPVFIHKIGESRDGEVVDMSGSEWAVYADEAGTAAANPLAPAPAAVVGRAGMFTITLEPGTYWLHEVKALSGFQVLPQKVKFTVDNDGAVSLTEKTEEGLSDLITVTESGMAGKASTIEIRDVPAMNYPDASGELPGSWHLIAGGALLLGTTALLVSYVRRRPGHGAHAA